MSVRVVGIKSKFSQLLKANFKSRGRYVLRPSPGRYSPELWWKWKVLVKNTNYNWLISACFFHSACQRLVKAKQEKENKRIDGVYWMIKKFIYILWQTNHKQIVIHVCRVGGLIISFVTLHAWPSKSKHGFCSVLLLLKIVVMMRNCERASFVSFFIVTIDYFLSIQ